jgi:hypothetical protein
MAHSIGCVHACICVSLVQSYAKANDVDNAVSSSDPWNAVFSIIKHMNAARIASQAERAAWQLQQTRMYFVLVSNRLPDQPTVTPSSSREVQAGADCR